MLTRLTLSVGSPLAIGVVVSVLAMQSPAFGSTALRSSHPVGTRTSGLRTSPGALDTTFSGDGKVMTQFASTSADQAAAVAIQADGKIVAAGMSHDGYDGFALARYNIDGTLDSSFGDSGEVVTYFNAGSEDEAFAVAIQTDGKIVAAGATGSSDRRFAVARYNADGSPDSTFGGDGKVTTHFGTRSVDLAFAVAVQADGKIVAAGVSNDRFALARYKPDGTRDGTFSGDGRLTTRFRAASSDEAHAAIIQGDGSILVAGQSYPSSTATSNFALARYDSRGRLDPSFGGDGKVTTDFSGAEDAGVGVAMQADGKIVAAGFSRNTFALARYTTRGRLDTTFGGDGKVTTHFATGSTDGAQAVAVQADGKIIAVGDSFLTHVRFAIARYTARGRLDATFGGDGRVITQFATGSDDIAFGVAIQADGKIVAAGNSQPSVYESEFALARYLAA